MYRNKGAGQSMYRNKGAGQSMYRNKGAGTIHVPRQRAPDNPCASTKTPGNPGATVNPCAAAIIPEVESTMPVDKIIAALKAPPKISVQKIYSLDEIRKMYEIGNLLQAVEVKSMAFEFDSTEVKGMQAGYLGNVARSHTENSGRTARRSVFHRRPCGCAWAKRIQS